MRLIIVLSFLFVLNPSVLNSQNIIDSPKIMLNSDYMAFRVMPEDQLYPHLQFFEPEDLGISISLTFLHLENFISDPSFLIDTIYFSGFDKTYKEYRRIYSYNDSFMINSVKAEVFLEDKWNLHQITYLSYNRNGNIVQIISGRYEEKSDSIIINYLYNKNGLLLEEFASIINQSDSSLKNGWKKNYSYNDKDLVKYTFEKIGKPNWYEADSVKCKYNQSNLLIERADFMPEIQGLESEKFVWNYNNDPQLIEYYFLTFRRLDTLSIESTQYTYNENGKILRETQVERNKYDKFPNQIVWEYKYDEIGRLDSINQTGKILLENSDSSLFNTTSKLNYNSNGFLVGFQKLGKYMDNVWGRKVIYTRDSNNNVTFAREETLSQSIWKQGPCMRIVYKRR